MQVSVDDAVVQYVTLGNNEHVVSMYKRTFPSSHFSKLSLTEKRPSVEADIRLKKNTVLDGCIIVTNKAVYELTPRYCKCATILQTM